MFTFSKEVNVTNHKNVLVQVPRAVVTAWGLRIGDKLEVRYQDNSIIIRPVGSACNAKC